MSAFSTAINNLFAGTPLSSTFGPKVYLSDGEDKALIGEEKTEKCELRIEGMTCGACVEVCLFHTVHSEYHGR